MIKHNKAVESNKLEFVFQLTMDNGRLTMKVEIPLEFQYIIAGIIS